MRSLATSPPDSEQSVGWFEVTDPLEPQPRDRPLRRMDGARVTPHVGAIDRTVRTAMARVAIENLEAYFAGRSVPDRVTSDMLDYMT